MNKKEIKVSSFSKFLWKSSPIGNTKKSLIQFLLKDPTFAGLTKFELYKVLGYLHVRAYSPKETIFEAQNEGHGLFIVYRGQCIIDNSIELSEGQVFGELGLLIKGHRRIYSAVSSGKTELVCLLRSDFRDLLVEFPKIGAKLSFNIARHLAYKLESLTIGTQKRGEEVS